MYHRLTPSNIIKQRQHKVIALFLILTLTLTISYQLLVATLAHATSTYTWSGNQLAQGNTTASTTVSLNNQITLTPQYNHTDTTVEDFRGGYSPEGEIFSYNITDTADGEVTLGNGWRYHTGSAPALASSLIFHTFKEDNLLYISTWGGGLHVINTQGTEDPSDDTLVTRYHTGSTLALANNGIGHTFKDGNLLYVSTFGGGLSVINTQGTESPGDDTLVTRYHTGSTPALADNFVLHTFKEDNLLYVSTDGGLSVINTQGTLDPSDDTLVTRYHTGSTPALAHNLISTPSKMAISSM